MPHIPGSKSNMTLEIVNNPFLWSEFVEKAIVDAKNLFVKEMGWHNEYVGVKHQYKNKSWVHTICAFKDKESSLFFLSLLVSLATLTIMRAISGSIAVSATAGLPPL